MSMLQLIDLSVGYGRGERATVVASGIDRRLHAGELVCLLGPNGAGKSTLMRTVAGMQAPLRGRVLIDDGDVHAMDARERAKLLSVVLTDRVEAGLLTGYALVGLGRYPHTGWSGKLSDRDWEVVEACIDRTGARDLAHRHVSDLSDGERQRIMLARALAQEPRLMVLDEITAFLDLPRRVDAMRLLRRLARDTGTAILLSTHDLDLALKAADQVWLLPSEGPMVAGAPEDLVLSGAFAAVFESEGVEFDARLGSFQLHRRSIAEVELVGGGLVREWTARAIERQGLGIWGGLGATPGIRVEVLDNGGGWELEIAGVRGRASSLADLAERLRGADGARDADVEEAR